MNSTTEKFKDGQVFTIYDEIDTEKITKISILELYDYHDQNKREVKKHYKTHINSFKIINSDYYEILIRHLCHILNTYKPENSSHFHYRVKSVSMYDRHIVYLEVTLYEKAFYIYLNSDNIGRICYYYGDSSNEYKVDSIPKDYINMPRDYSFSERIQTMYTFIEEIIRKEELEDK